MKSPLFTPAWWNEILDRIGRQAIQVVIPVLALGVGGDLSGVDPLDVVLTLALSSAVVVLKSVLGLSGGNWIERALGAAAGAALSLLPVKAFDLLTLDWRAFSVAVASSTALAVAMSIANPTVAGEVTRVRDTRPGEALPS